MRQIVLSYLDSNKRQMLCMRKAVKKGLAEVHYGK